MENYEMAGKKYTNFIPVVLQNGRGNVTCRKSGFTLIELLVVISIIALLLSIILPALSKAREQTYMVICQSQLKQMGLGINVYANEYDGLIVPGDYAMGHDIWNVNIDDMTNNKMRPVNLGHLLDAGMLPMPQNNKHPFYCPAMEKGLKRVDKFYGLVYDHPDRGFRQGWELQIQPVNIGYDYRDSIDEGTDWEFGGVFSTPHTGVRDVEKVKISDIPGSKTLASDVFAWGMAAWAHKDRYNLVRVDGSADRYLDNGDPDWLYNKLYFAYSDYTLFMLFDRPTQEEKERLIVWP